MDRSQRFGYFVYPLVLFLSFAAPRLLAQNSPGAPPAAPSETQQQPENPQQDQVRMAQQAQARIRARREARVRKAVEDTYTHRFELYGGGGYLRFRPGKSLQQTNQAAWNVGFTDYIKPRWGLTGDIRAYYGTAFVTPNQYNIYKPSISEYSYMGGPQYRIVRRIHWAISGQVLAGVTKGIFNGNDAQFPGTLLGMWPNAAKFAVNVGAPVDYNLGPGLAIRVTPNYLFTTFGSSIQTKNIGFTSSIVFRFGRR